MEKQYSGRSWKVVQLLAKLGHYYEPKENISKVWLELAGELLGSKKLKEMIVLRDVLGDVGVLRPLPLKKIKLVVRGYGKYAHK